MKNLLLFLVCLTSSFSVKAQRGLPSPQNNNSYANRMQHIFGGIDKTKITTGYLKEFGVRFANIEACNGNLTTANFVTKSEWQALYGSLYSMRVGTVAQNMTAPQIVHANFKTQQNNTDDVLIAVQHYNYQRYKKTAVRNRDVYVLRDRIYDVNGRNPYDVKTVFAATPLKQHIQGNTFNFRLPGSFIYTNTGLNISQIQIDFGNGKGYQTISTNNVKSISYTTSGEKTIKVKFSYTNGSTVYSHSKIWVDYIAPNHNTQARFNGNGFLLENGVLWLNNPVSGNVWNGSSATGRVTIELAP